MTEVATKKLCTFVEIEGRRKLMCKSSKRPECDKPECKGLCGRHCYCDPNDKRKEIYCSWIDGKKCSSGCNARDCCGKCQYHCRCALKTPAKARSNREATRQKVKASSAVTPMVVKYGISHEVADANTKLFDVLSVDANKVNRILPDRARYSTNPLFGVSKHTKEQLGDLFFSMMESVADLMMPHDTSEFLMRMLYTKLEKKFGTHDAGDTTLPSILEHLKIDKKSFKNMPSRSICDSVDAVRQIEALSNKRAKGALVNLLEATTKAIANLIIPQDDTDWLMREFAATKMNKKRDEQMSGRIAVLESLARGLFEVKDKMKKHTMAHRTVQAIIAAKASQHKLDKFLEHLNPPKIWPNARKRGRGDYDGFVKYGMDPEKTRRSLRRVPDAAIETAVAHILSKVQTLSWGKKTVWKNGSNEPIDIPKTTRKMPITTMLKDYRKEIALLKAANPKDKRAVSIGRTAYFRIAGTLTSRSEKQKKCIDYVTDILINERMDTLDTIINDLVAPMAKQDMHHHLEIVQNFLKYHFDKHVRLDDKICTHNAEYALTFPNDSPHQVASMIKGAEECKGCKYVDYYMHTMLPDAIKACRTDANAESVEDALCYIDDALECFHLFQAHRVRAVNQQIAIEKLVIEMKVDALKRRGRSKIVRVQIDFKQKYLERRFRSAQALDFGQRGISWHICVIEYYEYEAPSESNGWEERAVPVRVPLDQILNGGNKQDGQCVLSMVEAMMKMVATELPWIEEIVLVSDNAGCYHSKNLIFGIPLLNRSSTGPKVTRSLHPETQDGKDLCDTHAAACGAHIDRHGLETRETSTKYQQACTANEIADSLCKNGGMKNSAVQVIELDLPHLQKISSKAHKQFKATEKDAGKYLGRVNEIRYFPGLDEGEPWFNLDMQDESNLNKFTSMIQVISYSNVSEGGKFLINFGEGLLEHLPEAEFQSRKELLQAAKDALRIHQELNFTADLMMTEEEMLESVRREMNDPDNITEVSAEDSLLNDDENIWRDDDYSSSNGNALADVLASSFSDHEDVSTTDFENEYQNTLALLTEYEISDDQTIDSESSVIEEDQSALDELIVDSSKKDGPKLQAPGDAYQPSKFFTRVRVTKQKKTNSHLVAISSSKKKQPRKRKEVKEYTSKALLDKAIDMAPRYMNASNADSPLATNKYNIRDAMSTMHEYNVANGWRPSLFREKGWARKKTSGGMYGKSYLNDEYKKICEEQFQRGIDNSSDKQSPSQVVELIKASRPGLYRYPTVHEVTTYFVNLNNKKKKETPSSRKKAEEAEKKKAEDAKLTNKEEIDSILEGNLEKRPLDLLKLWIEKFREEKPEIVDDEVKLARVKVLIQNRRNNIRACVEREANRRLAG